MSFVPDDLVSQLQARGAEDCPYCAVCPAVPCFAHRKLDDPDVEPEWVTLGRRNGEIVRAATGVEGHAIRCGWAVFEIAGLHTDWTEADCAKLIGRPFRWLRWPNEGAIVAAEPQGQSVRVEVWAVPSPPTWSGAFKHVELTRDQVDELRLYADDAPHNFGQRPNRNLIRRNLLTLAPTHGKGSYRITEAGRAALAERA